MEEKTTMVIDETQWSVGNFTVEKIEIADEAYLKVSSVSGHWSVSYRDDNEMYGKLMAMVALREESRVKGEESSGSLLEMHVLWLYHNTNMMIDAEFANDYFSALERMRDRMAERESSVFSLKSSEEEDAALAEAEVFLNIKD